MQTFTMEILRHKDLIDELVNSGHQLMSTCSEEEKQAMKVGRVFAYVAGVRLEPTAWVGLSLPEKRFSTAAV